MSHQTEKTSVARGGKIIVSTGPDKSSAGTPEKGAKSTFVGKDMKDTGVGHSLSGGNVKKW